MAHSESVFTVQATIYFGPHQLETLAAVVSPAPVRVKNQEQPQSFAFICYHHQCQYPAPHNIIYIPAFFVLGSLPVINRYDQSFFWEKIAGV